jgi:hypothetical protein
MVQTICQHYEGFTKHEVRNAIAGCKAQSMTRHPSNAQFKNILRNKTIKIAPSKPTTLLMRTQSLAWASQECAGNQFVANPNK